MWQLESLLRDLVNNMARQQTLKTLSMYQSFSSTLGSGSESKLWVEDHADPSKDINGQDKQKVKASVSSRYFQCDKCKRQIAGGRFAQHITKCLERRRKLIS